ncbi:hypothetical protein [Peptoniphilus harei]|uniref:hypothetical protein n=1 Tax=Peptoniphilus harei TaxID=54005 RepID=UPI002586F798|nr:hypothetical protein [Peptoniphilus harei]MDU6743246.1 hypothetical protein [Peptoniphilus harei]
MKIKKIFYLFLVLIFLTACKKDQSHEIKFSTGEVYKFEDLSVEVIADEEKMTTREIFSSEGNEEKLGEIINLLGNCKVVDQGYSYASIPGYESLIINLKDKNKEDTIYMYDSERDRNTNKFHYSFYGKLGHQESPTLLSDDDLISEIKYIVDK